MRDESTRLSRPGQEGVGPPAIATDGGGAIVKVTKSPICGTDLHILKGNVPTCAPGSILGHEGVGIVDSVGDSVTNFRPGDHVLILWISSAANANIAAAACIRNARLAAGPLVMRSTAPRPNMSASRADTGLYPIPAGADEDALVRSSAILPTGFECDAAKAHALKVLIEA